MVGIGIVVGIETIVLLVNGSTHHLLGSLFSALCGSFVSPEQAKLDSDYSGSGHWVYNFFLCILIYKSNFIPSRLKMNFAFCQPMGMLEVMSKDIVYSTHYSLHSSITFGK
jgi:hypothetical protein